MYLRAGLLDGEGQQGVLAAIAVDPDLTIAQKQSLSQIYETFRNETARQAPAAAEPAAAPPAEATHSDDALSGVMRDVAVAENGAAPAPETTQPEEK
jgi:hypothetical protein